MILELVLDILFGLFDLIILMLPTPVVDKIANVSPPVFISWATCFFPTDVITITLGMFVTWTAIFMTWAIVEWVYKKIPGVS